MHKTDINEARYNSVDETVYFVKNVNHNTIPFIPIHE